jgi:hypothetical protein
MRAAALIHDKVRYAQVFEEGCCHYGMPLL